MVLEEADMNKEEIARQIAKFKARRLKTRLAHYSLLTSLLLTLSIFAGGLNSSTLTSFFVMLPVPLYFGMQSLKLARKSRLIKERLSTLESNISLLESKFSVGKFFTQPSLAFRLTLILFFLACFTSFARLSDSQNTSSSITYNLEAGK